MTENSTRSQRPLRRVPMPLLSDLRPLGPGYDWTNGYDTGVTGPECDPDEEREPPGGAAACDLHRVCDACGALEDGPPAPVCGRCGTARAG